MSDQGLILPYLKTGVGWRQKGHEVIENLPQQITSNSCKHMEMISHEQFKLVLFLTELSISVNSSNIRNTESFSLFCSDN